MPATSASPSPSLLSQMMKKRLMSVSSRAALEGTVTLGVSLTERLPCRFTNVWVSALCPDAAEEGTVHGVGGQHQLGRAMPVRPAPAASAMTMPFTGDDGGIGGGHFMERGLPSSLLSEQTMGAWPANHRWPAHAFVGIPKVDIHACSGSGFDSHHHLPSCMISWSARVSTMMGTPAHVPLFQEGGGESCRFQHRGSGPQAPARCPDACLSTGAHAVSGSPVQASRACRQRRPPEPGSGRSQSRQGRSPFAAASIRCEACPARRCRNSFW